MATRRRNAQLAVILRIAGMASMSASSSTSALPEISTTKTSLVEAASCRSTARSPPPCSLAGGSERDARQEPSGAPPVLLGRRATSASPQAGWSLKAATVPLYAPRPPSTSPRGQPATRRTLEYIRLSRSELENKDQAITSLRAENVQLQARVRELQNMQESHATLQSVCVDLAQCLGCSVEGVAAESVRDVLHSQASSVLQDRQHTQQQLRVCRSELESSKGEAAAASVRLSGLESQLQQTSASLASKDSEIQQQRAELERLQQSEARSSAALHSVRQQLAEVEEGRGEEARQRLPELHTEIGRLRTALKEKDECLIAVQGQLEASQTESEGMQERIANLEAMYEDLCSQLTMALELEEETDTHDVDSLIAQVGGLSQECSELRLRVDTLTKTLKTCELDSKASRETILRLVSEGKKHNKLDAQLAELQQARMEQDSLLTALERERDELQERLLAGKETMVAQEQEIQAKETRVCELVSSWQSLKSTSDAERGLIASEQQKYEEFCKAVGGLVGSQSTDSIELLQALEQLVQARQHLGQRLSAREEKKEGAGGGRTHTSLQARLSEVEGALERERSKVKQLEGELVTHTVVKEGMDRDIEKEQEFYQRLSRALKLDSATARVLTGDFARDAILIRAEQLAKQETQVLAEKQSALYSAQRQLKTCRQTLESKELYLGLLQKKTASLEERVQSFSHREAQLETLGSKCKKLEKQVERLRVKVAQQTEDNERLRAENTEMGSLQARCGEQESEIVRLSGRVEQLSEARSEQARHLAEARLRLQSGAGRERKGEGEKGGGGGGREQEHAQLRLLQEQLSQAREAEQKFITFRTATQRLLTDIGVGSATGEAKGETPSDYDLMAQLERLVADHKQLQDMVKCLGSSLQQLEQGFKTGYSDALTILQTRA